MDADLYRCRWARHLYVLVPVGAPPRRVIVADIPIGRDDWEYLRPLELGPRETLTGVNQDQALRDIQSRGWHVNVDALVRSA